MSEERNKQVNKTVCFLFIIATLQTLNCRGGIDIKCKVFRLNIYINCHVIYMLFSCVQHKQPMQHI